MPKDKLRKARTMSPFEEPLFQGCPKFRKKIKGQKTAAVFIRRMPVYVRDQFKAYCAERGLTMVSAIIWLMEMVIKRRNQLEIERTGGKPYERVDREED